MERILIIKPSSLGDILHALQVVESLREQRGPENVEITWLVRDTFAPIVAGTPTVDRSIIFERSRGLHAVIALGERLRREQFDLVLDMQGLARSAFWAFCAKAPRKIGRGDGREGSRFCFRELAAAPEKGYKKSHAVEILLQFLPRLGLKAELCGHVLFRAVDAGIKLPESPILLFPDSRRAEKEWPYFVGLTGKLLERLPHTPIVWVGQSPLKPDPAWRENPYFFNLMGQTQLSVLPGLIQGARLCITNDSGPMHIAAAMGKSVLGIFGPTPPELYGPFPSSRASNQVICAPEDNLKALGLETVCAKVLSLL